jgi:hypothetical protein
MIGVGKLKGRKTERLMPFALPQPYVPANMQGNVFIG